MYITDRRSKVEGRYLHTYLTFRCKKRVVIRIRIIIGDMIGRVDEQQ